MNDQAALLVLEQLQRIADVLWEIQRVLREQNWTCGCGQVNAPTLQLCSRCARKPGEQR